MLHGKDAIGCGSDNYGVSSLENRGSADMGDVHSGQHALGAEVEEDDLVLFFFDDSVEDALHIPELPRIQPTQEN